MSVSRIVRWKLLMQHFDTKWHYLAGERNILADCFSRLPQMDRITVGDREIDMIENNRGTEIDWNNLQVPRDINEIFLTLTFTKKLN